MSAWIVSQNHIRLLVESLYKYEVIDGADHALTPDVVGHILWRENYRSVNYRYSERHRTPHYVHRSDATATWTYPYPNQGMIRDLVRNPALVYKQASCYKYQSNEHPGWNASQACAFVTKLQEVIEKNTGTAGRDNNEPWGIE